MYATEVITMDNTSEAITIEPNTLLCIKYREVTTIPSAQKEQAAIKIRFFVTTSL